MNLIKPIVRNRQRLVSALIASLSSLAFVALGPAARGIAYGTLNNFDCVNDTGVEAHGFDIELDDIHSTDITYTYDYNHYGVPKITESSFLDASSVSHPRVLIRYAATWDPGAQTWSAFTAIPSGPITPTDGHQFTNPSINFGGEHFGAGYFSAPTAVRYNWLIDGGSGSLVHGPPVSVATPTFTYAPPAPAQPVPQVQAVIVPPPPPEDLPPAKQFGVPIWVKEIKTTTHNANKVELTDLVDPDPDNAAAPNWANGEPAEIEVEWQLLQTEFANLNNPKGVLEGAPEDLPGGDEIITRRYEFYKYTGPLDAESGEAVADQVGALAPDGIHYYGSGTVEYNDHIDPNTGEWVTVTTDLSTVEVVGDFIGAQMSGFDVAPVLGLIDHIPDSEVNVAYADRTVVIPGGDVLWHAVISSGVLPDGTALDEVTGVFSGTPTVPDAFTFTVEVRDLLSETLLISKSYTVTITGVVGPGTGTISTSSFPAAGGSTSGDGIYNIGTPVTVIATHNPGYAFVNWTENGLSVSQTAVYPFTVNSDRNLVANFVPVFTITTIVTPTGGGTTTGDGVYNDGSPVTVVASANPGFRFFNWTENGTELSQSLTYDLTAHADHTLVANFIAVYNVTTSASPAGAGTTSGAGLYDDGSPVVVTATPNLGFDFVNWTEAGAVVSTVPSYSFIVSGQRHLVASFTAQWPSLVLTTASAARVGSKVDVTMTISNEGGQVQGVEITGKKDATIDAKATNERPPVVLGDLSPGGTATTTLTFSGVKAGTHTLHLKLVFSGGTATLTTTLVVP